MNDKVFIKTKVAKSLRIFFGKPHLSSYELLRMNSLDSIIKNRKASIFTKVD